MLKINQIYKVKEGHEGNCFYYRAGKGSYIQIIDKNNKDEYFFKILDDNKEFLNVCDSCFTEDDLELEEEVKVKYKGNVSLANPNPEAVLKVKSLEDLEEKLLVKIDLPNDNRLVKIKLIGNVLDCQYNQSEQEIYVYSQTPDIHELSPSEAETLLEEKLGIKVKIK